MSYLLIRGDARRLGFLPDGCVQCCVTSPPYFGLRDYGTGEWVGGAPGCDHLGEPMRTKASINANCGTGTDRKNAEGRQPFRSHCGKCGARRVDRQIGLEPTPAEFVAAMVAVFREVRRVLADDGTLWLNLGDTYNAYNGGAGPSSSEHEGRRDAARPKLERGHGLLCKSLKPKDLIGVPWRVALALQDDGWYLRSEIIWAKPNPMPESIADRPTKAHEHIFLLAKSTRYYFDQDAAREPAAASTLERDRYTRITAGKDGHYAVQHDHETPTNPLGRNCRSVWNIALRPFPGAHFAVFPPELPERCIRAGSRPGDLVLDPFNGSGTTGAVATGLGRRYVGVDLNREYLEMAGRRIERPHAAIARAASRPSDLPGQLNFLATEPTTR